ncbi:hypothetical protein K227x_59990 [Rubripirellula lacrimiformis]|uniref:Planctomycete cytochrome C n=1 Tax=Rubripirellula lacrimiformis TaxID=1930273 RepID=A0A517NKA3_9BACT|nr:DUF1592 domain-containing protein [Rubripirellula lacrimiformis]QDT07571.1 hypothetical protein K227x_59990 [Rubripirellula lacrimiformis]
MLFPARIPSRLRPTVAAIFIVGLALENPIGHADDFSETVDAFTTKHCIECHDDRQEKGDFRIDSLSRDLTDPAIAIAWQDAIDLVEVGEMPPEDHPSASPNELKTFLLAVKTELARTAESSAPQSETRIRRLSHSAMDNTVGDLMGTRLRLSAGLPEDPELAGFDNMASTLGQSSEMMHLLQQNARRIASDATAGGDDPRADIDLDADQMTLGSRVARVDDTLILWSSKNRSNTTWPADFVAPRTGVYRIGLTGFQWDNRYHLDRQNQIAKPDRAQQKSFHKRLPEGRSRQVAIMALQAPIQNALGESTGGRRVGTLTIDDQPKQRWVECELEAGESFFVYATDCPRSQNTPWATIEGSDKVILGEQLHLSRLQIQGPLLPTWPPRFPEQLLDPSGQISNTGLKQFLTKAFRQPVEPEVFELYRQRFVESRHQGQSAQQSLSRLIEAVLCSPRFLYTVSPESPQDAWGIANRLSYFLWNSMPDEHLMRLAESGALIQPDVIADQTRRMLADPKADGFVIDFAGQWLGLRKVGDMLPDPGLYPEYDLVLEQSMRAESESLFREVLTKNLPVTDFLAPRFAMLNQRLAKHYGIDGVLGNEIRSVPVPADSPRGGLLGHASMLTTTSNGTRTSPVVRGVWVLENLLDSPPSPPPPDVEPIEPDVRGATTIREMLAKHRDVATCKECHRRIDPWGFGLENFDAVGAWRDRYGIDQRGKPVDATGKTPSGQTFDSVVQMRDQLLAQSDRFAEALASKLLSHAIGHPASIQERIEIEQIVQRNRNEGGRFADLIVLICQSESFRTH